MPSSMRTAIAGLRTSWCGSKAPRARGLQVSVSDDGVGLPACFDPGATGASLGMRIVTGLVRQLGASLRWEDQGGGARFIIDLPVTHPLGKR